MHLAVIEHTYQGHTVRAVVDNDEVVICGIDLTGLTGLTRNGMRAAIARLEPEDKRVVSTNTSTGPKNTVFLTESGACQIIVQSRKPEAAKLRKQICDLFVDVRRGRMHLVPAGQATAAVPAPVDYHAIAQVVASVVAECLKPVLQAVHELAGGSPRPGSTRLVLDASKLPRWTAGEHKKMRSAGYTTASDFLTRLKGVVQHPGVSGGLTRRVVAWCAEMGVSAYYFRRGSKVVVYLPEVGTKIVWRTGWSAKSAVLAEAQGELFNELDKKTA